MTRVVELMVSKLLGLAALLCLCIYVVRGLHLRQGQSQLEASLQSQTSNNACIDVNPDVLNSNLRSTVTSVIGIIATAVGGPAAGLASGVSQLALNLFWPSSNCPIWEASKEAVLELIDLQFQQEDARRIKNDLARLNANMEIAFQATPDTRLYYDALDSARLDASFVLADITSLPQTRRKHFVSILGSLGLVHMLLDLTKWTRSESDNNADLIRSVMVRNADLYQSELPKMLQEWKEWRLNQFSYDSTVHSFHIASQLCGFGNVPVDERFTDLVTGFHQSWRTCCLSTGLSGCRPSNAMQSAGYLDAVKARIVNEEFAQLLQYVTPSFYFHATIPPTSGDEPTSVDAVHPKIPESLERVQMGPYSFFTTGEVTGFEVDPTDLVNIEPWFKPFQSCVNTAGYRRIAAYDTGSRIESLGVGFGCTLGRAAHTFDESDWFGGEQDDPDNDNFVEKITLNFIFSWTGLEATVHGIEARLMNGDSSGLIGGPGGTGTNGVQNNDFGIQGYKIVQFDGGRAFVNGRNTLVSIQTEHAFHEIDFSLEAP